MLFFHCKKTTNKTEKAQQSELERLFVIQKEKVTGINFKNIIKETSNLNGILYEYLYNGAGVALADFNLDGLLDIYFASTLENNALYINKGNLNFLDITGKSSLRSNSGFTTGVSIVDINLDGRPDIYVCKSGKYNNPDDRRNQLFINVRNDEKGNPVFKEDAKKYGLDLPHFSTQAAFFDYDRDGDLDLFLINHGTRPYEDEMLPNLMRKEAPFQSSRLFQNQNQSFIDVSSESGIINNGISFGLGVAIGDLNNDGWPDVLVGHDFSEKDHLYLNQQDGTFKEVMDQAANHISYFSMGNDIADINNDGWLDFLSLDMMSENNYDIKTSMSGMNPERFYALTEKGLHHQYMYNALQLNNGVAQTKNNIPVFSDAAQIAGVSNTDWSWGPLFFDMDNDGYQDLFVSNGIKKDFRNNDFLKYKQNKFDRFFSQYGRQTPENKKRARQLTLQLVNEMPNRSKPNYFFQNNKGHGFTKTNNLWVKDVETSSNGAAYGDLDNDGDLDIVVNNMDDLAFVYENKANELNSNNYLNINLEGPSQNPQGIGVRVKIALNQQQQIKEKYNSRGFQSAAAAPLHFGLGGQQNIKLLTVIWPDGKTQELRDIKANQTLLLSYKNAQNSLKENTENSRIFKDVTQSYGLQHIHKENKFNDFERESLLPHRMSQMGPALAVDDINKDGLDDFYIGGALGYSGALYIQKQNGSFVRSNQPAFTADLQFEDVAALFLDADGDGNKDLYVVSGGNEYQHGNKLLQDRLYLNIDGSFTETAALPQWGLSGACVKASDYDNDGDLDLFIGGRQKPGQYPEAVSSKILRNDSQLGKPKFTDVTTAIAPGLENLGMVTDAVWFNYDSDGKKDLLLVGEWMAPRIFKNTNGTFVDVSENTQIAKENGWWFSVAAADFDGDGDEDFIAGNLGLNYKYKATTEAPFEIFQTDFDNNGTRDIALGYYETGDLYPLRGRECSSNQVPSIKEKFKTYDAFAQATLVDVYGEKKLEKATHYAASTFASAYFRNNGNGTFTKIPLGFNAQLSSINSITIHDFDLDGHLDALLSGNWYVAEVETPRNDASFGVYLKGNGEGFFTILPAFKSGLYVSGDVRNSDLVKTANGLSVLVAKNNGPLQYISVIGSNK